MAARCRMSTVRPALGRQASSAERGWQHVDVLCLPTHPPTALVSTRPGFARYGVAAAHRHHGHARKAGAVGRQPKTTAPKGIVCCRGRRVGLLCHPLPNPSRRQAVSAAGRGSSMAIYAALGRMGTGKADYPVLDSERCDRPVDMWAKPRVSASPRGRRVPHPGPRTRRQRGAWPTASRRCCGDTTPVS